MDEDRAHANDPGSASAGLSKYTLLEHRQGYTVASYLLTEGMIRPGETQVVESQMREVYEVVDANGAWRRWKPHRCRP